MKTLKKTSGLAIATAAAALLATAPMTVSTVHAASHGSAKVKCMGANACKGQSACATASTACAGHNACKGQGWVKLSAKDCEEAGGKPKG